eukprot:1790562-Prorocentrum_lima.AAC.1
MPHGAILDARPWGASAKRGNPLYGPVCIRAFRLDARMWLDIARPRLYVVLVAEAAAGRTA